MVGTGEEEDQLFLPVFDTAFIHTLGFPKTPLLLHTHQFGKIFIFFIYFEIFQNKNFIIYVLEVGM